MSGSFEQFIADGRVLADRHGLVWDVAYDAASGKIVKDQWWDLSAAAGKIERPRKVVSSFAAAASSRDAIESILGRRAPEVMAEPWIAFFKAIAAHDLFANGRTPGNFANNIAESFRILATCAGGTPPPLLSASIVSAAYNAALIASPSAKRASTLKALVANWLDTTGIADQRPLAQYCVADGQNALAVERQVSVVTTKRRQADSKRPNALRSELSQKHASGSEVRLAKHERFSHELYVRVGEMEEYARTHLPTKVPDLRPARSAVGWVGMEDRLFLYPGRALAEAKHDAIIDVERYFSVQTPSRQDLELQLGGKTQGGQLFQRYGRSEAARSYAINPHSLRHLQNTELFRLEVADTIITKRFNRRSTAQSYVYDHRTLAEHLEEMEPEKARLAEKVLAPNARKAFDLIRGGKIQGPVVEAFRRVQRDDGDEAAFEYLNAEAGALHFTPYGFCLNSFAASPCVKHLECFNGCNHLVRTQSLEEQNALETLRGRYEIHIQRLKDRPSKAPNFAAQLAHAEERLAGVRAALAKTPGQAVFESGEDLYATAGELLRV